MRNRIGIRRTAVALALSLAFGVAMAETASAQLFPRIANAGEDDPSPGPLSALRDLFRRGPELLRLPVAGAVVTSGYGSRRNPFTGGWQLHSGVDLSAPTGTPIMAAGDGVVVSAGWENGYGYTTRIRHADGVETMYAHQSAIAAWIGEGVRVRQRDIIGAIGSTGNATGPHLHYEVRVNGTTVDPFGAELVQAGLVGG